MNQHSDSSCSEKDVRPRIAIGYKVGNLTVIAATQERKNGYTVWECLCGCGNKILLDTRCLQRRTITDCGCISKVRPGQRDLTGKRFGRLVCIEPTEQRSMNGSTVWRCQCDCGAQCLAAGKQLTSGYKKSCGCWGHPPLKDFIAERFGMLTVTEYAGKRNGMHRWKCLCDCGKETVVGQTLLQSGKTRSCGCLQAKTIISNLQLCEGTSVTILESARKHRLRSNKSGYTGVYQNTRSERWVAQITFKGKTYYLGSYKNIEDAVKARKRGEEMHENFLQWYYQEYKCPSEDLAANP